MEILFFFSPLYSMTTLMQEALSVFSLFMQQLRCGFIQILLAQSSAQKKKKNGDGFQQRGQKNSANSLQMCLWAVWGNTVLPSPKRKKDSALEKVQWITSKKKKKKPQPWPSTAGFPWKRKEATQEHIVFTPWRNCRYAESHECMLVI